MLRRLIQSLTTSQALPNKRIAVAVSGGPDSLATSIVARDISRILELPEPVGVVVDHQLRSESTSEAYLVADTLQRIGIQPLVLSLDNLRSCDGGVQEKARDARYHLFLDSAVRYGCDHLWTGHHREDAIETVLFRLLRRSGWQGLASVDFARKIFTSNGSQLVLLRPLLPYRKNTAVSLCRENNVNFVTDPSNASMKYARNRIRAFLAGEPELVHSLDALRRQCVRLKATTARMVFAALSKYGTYCPSTGCYELVLGENHKNWSCDLTYKALILQAMLGAVRGNRTSVPLSRAARACVELCDKRRVTVGGCFVELKASRPSLHVSIEPKGILESSVGLQPGEQCLVDNRFVITNCSVQKDITVTSTKSQSCIQVSCERANERKNSVTCHNTDEGALFVVNGEQILASAQAIGWDRIVAETEMTILSDNYLWHLE